MNSWNVNIALVNDGKDAESHASGIFKGFSVSSWQICGWEMQVRKHFHTMLVYSKLLQTFCEFSIKAYKNEKKTDFKLLLWRIYSTKCYHHHMYTMACIRALFITITCDKKFVIYVFLSGFEKFLVF